MSKIHNIYDPLQSYDKFKPVERNLDKTLKSFRQQGIEEIKNFIKRTKPTTYHNDPIPSKFRKRNIGILAPTIKDIVNHSLRNSTFDGSLKESIILPLQKKVGQDR